RHDLALLRRELTGPAAAGRPLRSMSPGLRLRLRPPPLLTRKGLPATTGLGSEWPALALSGRRYAAGLRNAIPPQGVGEPRHRVLAWADDCPRHGNGPGGGRRHAPGRVAGAARTRVRAHRGRLQYGIGNS